MRIIGTNESHRCVGLRVLYHLPVVLRSRDIGRVEQGDVGGVVVAVRVGEHAVCSCYHLEVPV